MLSTARHLRPSVESLASARCSRHLMAASIKSVTRASHTMQSNKRPVLLLDIMDTLVYDPFFREMPAFFGVSFKELLAAKHPSTWIDFECARISEAETYQRFFADGRAVDGAALRQHMVDTYRFLDGVESLLVRLRAAGYEIHAMSNYPMWYQLIESKLALSRYLQWTFISCDGVMRGHRKPSNEAFQIVLSTLQRPADELIFVDDRQINVDAAMLAGMDGVLFAGADKLEQQLLARGLHF